MKNRFSWMAPSAAVALVCVALASSARAQGVDTNSPELPPTVGEYFDAGPRDYPGAVGGFTVSLTDISVDNFTSIVHTPSGGDDVVTFNTVATGLVSVFIIANEPVTLSGSGQVLIDNNGATTGTFATEFQLLNLTGVPPAPLSGTIMLRESPTLASTGVTTVTDIGGGMFHIDSFFDVFTEVSFDGGLNWTPSSSASHLVLMPEPTFIGIVSLGILALRRRRRA